MLNKINHYNKKTQPNMITVEPIVDTQIVGGDIFLPEAQASTAEASCCEARVLNHCTIITTMKHVSNTVLHVLSGRQCLCVNCKLQNATHKSPHYWWKWKERTFWQKETPSMKPTHIRHMRQHVRWNDNSGLMLFTFGLLTAPQSSSSTAQSSTTLQRKAEKMY